MPRRRIWRDGDTYLVLALLSLLCGAAIVQHALVAENWVIVEEQVSAERAATGLASR